MARKRRGTARPIDAEAVIAGDVTPDATELIALIHRVNPTGQGLGKREEERRYRQKSALQSLLIRRFGEYLEAIPGEPEGVVSLRHRLWERDAAHAVVAELDDDARSWVLRYLDGVTEGIVLGDPGPTRAARGQQPTDALSAGLRAREEYDFDAARRLLQQAVADSGGAAGPARAFLALLVDDLAAWADCLQVASRLDAGSQLDPEIAGLLCEAAGRRADVDDCRRWSRLAAEPRRSVGLAEAARHAALGGDLDDADTLLAAANQGLRSSVPELHAAASIVEQRRAGAIEGARTELLKRLEGGSDEEAVRICEAFLHAHAGDTAVRQRRDAARRRLAEPLVRQHLDAAAGALAGGDLPGASAAAEKAERAWPGDPRTTTLVEQIDAGRREQRRALSRELILRSLTDGQVEDALRQVERLEDSDRAAIAAETEPVVAWFVALSAHHHRTSSDACIAAALALRAAAHALRDGRAESAEEMVLRHRRLLSTVPATDSMFEQIRAAAPLARRTAASHALRLTRAALVAGRLDEASSELASIRRGDLDEPGRGEAMALEEEVRAAQELDRVRSAADRAWEPLAGLCEAECPPEPSSVPALLAAEQALLEAAGRLTEPERGIWRARAAACRQYAVRHARLEVLPAGFFDDDRNRAVEGSEAPTLQLSEGRTGALWAIRDRLASFNADTGEARRCVLPGAGSWWVCVDEAERDRFRVTDGRRVGTFDAASLEPLSWTDLPIKFQDPEWVFLVRRGRFAWVLDQPRDRADGGEVHVLDRDTGAVRELGVLATALRGDAEADVIITESPSAGCRRWTTDGRPQSRFASPLWRYPVIRPQVSREHDLCFLLLAPGERRTEFEAEFELQLGPIGLAAALLAPDGTRLLFAPIPDLGESRIDVSAAMDGHSRMIVLDLSWPSRRRELRAHSWDALRPLWTCELPQDAWTVLWSNSETQRISLAVLGENGWQDVTLDSAARPDIRGTCSIPEGRLPSLRVGLTGACGPGARLYRPGAIASCRKLSPDLASAVARTDIKVLGGAVRQLLGRAVLLIAGGHDEAADLLIAHMSAQAPSHPALASLVGARASEGDKWERVLGAVGLAAQVDDHPHLQHLRAVAHLRLGRPEAAAACLDDLSDALRWTPCRLPELRRLVEPLPENPVHLVSALRAAVRDADRALSEGRTADALAAVDRAWLRAAGEVQAGARLVQALLAVTESGGMTASGEIAVSAWLGLLEDPTAPNLPYPEGFLDASELEALAVRARGVL